jgi:hypothetical protein
MDDLIESITNLNAQMTALLAAIQPLLAGAAAPPAAPPVAPAAVATTPSPTHSLRVRLTQTNYLSTSLVRAKPI